MATAPTIAMDATASVLGVQAEPANEVVPFKVPKIIRLTAQSIAAVQDHKDLDQ